MKKTILLICFSSLVGFLCIMAPARATAIPELQLYIEGAVYDTHSESWVYSGGTPTIRLWAIGNLTGPGGKGDIKDVRLSAAYEDQGPGQDAFITLTPSTTGGYGGFTDPTSPVGTGIVNGYQEGTSPTLSDGSSLPSHGIFGPGTEWQEFSLGDFTVSDSPIADFINMFPSSPVQNNAAQINVYELAIAGLGIDWVHFDLYGYYEKNGRQKAVFAPFSHDATVVPEPATMLLFGTGLIGMAAIGRRKFRKS